MQCSYKMRGGTVITVNGEHLTLNCFLFNENCTMRDILAIRYTPPNFWHHGSIKFVTNYVMERMRIAHDKKPVPYVYAFAQNQTAIFQQFYEDFLNEIRFYHGSEGTLVDGWWTWPEDEAPNSAEQNNVLAEAAPTNAPAPVAPVEPASAPSKNAVERAIQSVETEEKRQKGPACPDCGCTSIFADKDDGGVIITCLNCGRQWRPGEHRSW